VVALPISFVLAVGISLVSSRFDPEHLDYCWRNF
jgi:hypothetical protein